MSNTKTELIPALQLLAHRDRRRSVPASEATAHGQYLMFDDGREMRLLPVGATVVHVGRGMSVDVAIDDPTVSRRHATIARHGSELWLHDDCSANGTWVNGRRVNDTALIDGDVVSFGRATVVYRDTTPVRALAAA